MTDGSSVESKTVSTAYDTRLLFRGDNPEQVLVAPHRLLDRFIIDTHFNRDNPRTFSKAGIYRILEGQVPRPEHVELELPDKTDRTRSIYTPIVTTMGQMLNQYGAVYFKDGSGEGAGGAHGVRKISLEKYKSGEPMRLVLKEAHDETREIREGLDELHRSGHTDVIQFGPDASGGRLSFPILKTLVSQSQEDILTALVKHGFAKGEYVLEAPIPIALVGGKTWEIRNVVHCPEGIPQITAQFAKVGSGAEFSNLSAGGHPESAQALLEQLSQVYGGDMADYLVRNNQVALTAANTLGEFMKRLAASELFGIDPMDFYPRVFTVDITGTMNNGKLSPIVGELQYPVGPYNSYANELKKLDPQALTEIKQIENNMLAKDKELAIGILRKK